MLKAYVNYPNPRVNIHRHGDCSSIQQQRKAEQRVVRLETSTLSSELKKFEQKHYTFAAEPRETPCGLMSTSETWSSNVRS